MSKSIEEQISNKCVHFNGVMNSCCKKAVQYADVRFGRPYKFPCLNQGGECLHQQFPTPEQVEGRINEISGMCTATLKAVMLIKDHIKDTEEPSGVIGCECGGNLHYSVAGSNGHVAAKCSSCGLSFME